VCVCVRVRVCVMGLRDWALPSSPSAPLRPPAPPCARTAALQQLPRATPRSHCLTRACALPVRPGGVGGDGDPSGPKKQRILPPGASAGARSAAALPTHPHQSSPHTLPTALLVGLMRGAGGRRGAQGAARLGALGTSQRPLRPLRPPAPPLRPPCAPLRTAAAAAALSGDAPLALLTLPARYLSSRVQRAPHTPSLAAPGAPPPARQQHEQGGGHCVCGCLTCVCVHPVRPGDSEVDDASGGVQRGVPPEDELTAGADAWYQDKDGVLTQVRVAKVCCDDPEAPYYIIIIGNSERHTTRERLAPLAQLAPPSPPSLVPSGCSGARRPQGSPRSPPFPPPSASPCSKEAPLSTPPLHLTSASSSSEEARPSTPILDLPPASSCSKEVHPSSSTPTLHVPSASNGSKEVHPSTPTLHMHLPSASNGSKEVHPSTPTLHMHLPSASSCEEARPSTPTLNLPTPQKVGDMEAEAQQLCDDPDALSYLLAFMEDDERGRGLTASPPRASLPSLVPEVAEKHRRMTTEDVQCLASVYPLQPLHAAAACAKRFQEKGLLADNWSFSGEVQWRAPAQVTSSGRKYALLGLGDSGGAVQRLLLLGEDSVAASLFCHIGAVVVILNAKPAPPPLRRASSSSTVLIMHGWQIRKIGGEPPPGWERCGRMGLHS
jgi:hypothetical protein